MNFWWDTREYRLSNKTSLLSVMACTHSVWVMIGSMLIMV
jgi:hypothetical protein